MAYGFHHVDKFALAMLPCGGFGIRLPNPPPKLTRKTARAFELGLNNLFYSDCINGLIIIRYRYEYILGFLMA